MLLERGVYYKKYDMKLFFKDKSYSKVHTIRWGSCEKTTVIKSNVILNFMYFQNHSIPTLSKSISTLSI